MFLFVAFSSCFDRFFRNVNMKENKLISKRRGGYFMDDLNLIGVDYLWRVRTYSIFDVISSYTSILQNKEGSLCHQALICLRVWVHTPRRLHFSVVLVKLWEQFVLMPSLPCAASNLYRSPWGIKM